MSSKDIGVETLVHALKNPMAVILTGARCLLEREQQYGELNEKQKRVVLRILRNAIREGDLIGDILEIGRAKIGFFRISRFSPLHLIRNAFSEVFQELGDEFAERILECDNPMTIVEILEAKGIDLHFHTGFLNLEPLQDERKLRQVVRNLVLGGMHCSGNKIAVGFFVTGMNMGMSVAFDAVGKNGAGCQSIFRKFFQSPEGCRHVAGRHELGLAGVRIIIESMDGGFRLERAGRKEERLTVTLPHRLETKADEVP